MRPACHSDVKWAPLSSPAKSINDFSEIHQSQQFRHLPRISVREREREKKKELKGISIQMSKKIFDIKMLINFQKTVKKSTNVVRALKKYRSLGTVIIIHIFFSWCFFFSPLCVSSSVVFFCIVFWSFAFFSLAFWSAVLKHSHIEIASLLCVFFVVVFV